MNQGATNGGNINDNVTQNINFNEITPNHSLKSFDFFTPPIGFGNRGFTGSQVKRQLFVQNSPLVIGEISGLQSQSSDNQQIGQYLWGTDINITQIQLKIRKFLFDFRESSDNNTMDYNYYIRKLEEIINSDIYILNIDGNHINSYDRHLYIQLIKYPSEMIPLLDIVASQTLCEICPNRYMDDLNFKVQVRITNLSQKTRIRELGHNDIDKLICITGITIRNSEVIPEMRSALFKCAVCGLIQSSELQRSKVTEPSECKNCNSKYSFDLIHNRSIYSDKQHVKLQETPEHMPEGETPLTIHLCCYDQLVDYVKPGDRCEIVGIFRAQGLRVNPRKRVTKSIYRIFIDVVHFSKTTTKRQDIDEDDFDVFTEYNTNKFVQNEIKIKELSSNPDIYNILLDSFAPSIWENDDVKKGLLLQLFGGVSKDFSDTGRGRFRGDINILLVGDPSTAKSQLLQFTHNLAPRGIYTSGKGSSVVGLTAYITKDPETKEPVLESGALVLSDRGICCIDEFDKMDENTRVILHEAMEQQTISIAKAGIICQLNARSAILASANPIHSKYDPKLSVVDNIKLPPTLLSRFDLIYLMLDKQNDAYDRKLANHIVSLYGRFEDENKKEGNKYISRELLTAYISKAKKINPVIHESIVQYLIKNYLEMRSLSNSKKTISATPRQLESIIRISEGRARLRFSNFVEREDVDEAIRLVKVATQQAATNPETGVIDMDLINTGMSSSSRIKLNQLSDMIKNILRDYSEIARKGVKYSSIKDEVKKKIECLGAQSFNFSEFELRDSLRILEDENLISLLGNKSSPIIRLIGYEFQ